MVKVCMIGFGGIAAAHKNAYEEFAKERDDILLTGIYDINPESFTKETKINIDTGNAESVLKINFYTDLEEMLEKEQPDMIDICIPTCDHAEMAIKMLDRGYYVHCEKPMARTYAQTREMVEHGKGKLMIGQCLRFYPQYNYIKDLIDNGKYGKVKSAFFERISPLPTWGSDNWYLDFKKSGGCILDLHIHDIDMVRYLFGEPEAVSCSTADVFCGLDTAHTKLFYGDVPVTAIGDWALNGFPFKCGYRVTFEKAAVVHTGYKTIVYPVDGEPFDAGLPDAQGIKDELAYFVDTVIAGKENLRNPPESASNTVKLIETMCESAKAGGNRVEFIPE